MARGGMSVRVEDGPGSEMTLGFWPSEFQSRYQPGSFIGRLGGLRSKVLAIGKRHHDMIQAQRLAKASGKAADLPDIESRRRLALHDKKALDELFAATRPLDDENFQLRTNLTPCDYSKATPHERFLMEQRLQKLNSAKDDATRLRLMESRDYRLAAFAGGPDDHTLAGFSSQQAYARSYENNLRTLYPDAMQTGDDYKTGFEAFELAHKAASTALANELKNVGLPPSGEVKQPVQTPDWT
jgi:hypothetical protein